MTIRPTTPDDDEALLDFYRSLSEEVARVFLPESPVSHDTISAHLGGVETGACLSLVLEDSEGQVMGHAFIQPLDGPRPMVGIGLRDAIIGYGFGRRLMERLLQIADERRLPATWLSVVKGNDRAESLYRSLGYRRNGQSTFRRHNDSWSMIRRLPQRGDADARESEIMSLGKLFRRGE